MANSFRLRSGTIFSRPEEEKPIDSLRIVFLSVEGNNTEQDYFKFIEKYREQLGISKLVHVHALGRAHNDTRSGCNDVLELLEEYIELREAESLPDRLRTVIPSVYTDDFIQDY